MKRNRVNVLTVVNSASNITTETIDGKPHIVVRGITPVVDDIVMNRNEKAYNTLERNPMPLGHPKVDGKHVSARDVRAVNEYHVGAWLQNVSHEDGKLAAVLDLYSRRIVGWSMAPTMPAQLVCDALSMAISVRQPAPGLLVHSDRGSQYASAEHRQLLENHGLVLSMSRKGNPTIQKPNKTSPTTSLTFITVPDCIQNLATDHPHSTKRWPALPPSCPPVHNVKKWATGENDRCYCDEERSITAAAGDLIRVVIK